MKIISNNNQPFKGLNLAKVNPQDMVRVIEPCKRKLSKLAQKADIKIESATVLQKSRNFISPRPVLNVSIEPFDNQNTQAVISNYSMIINEMNIKNHTLLKLIKKTI